ncbi:hypothetical protein [Streptomonospora wellingtoniae]|uniref:Uncharacterized protein n=1 Tax=Streptomonospora wellingtoniae TaxID=3075544 RepID=A0ABU2L1I4_9ACTN|nr:hypothetical protein [Streptomonospora sp. DSM 45055]MDT0305123.1 hypothetical protein [Streptomonospora sp. DSM 45055]
MDDMRDALLAKYDAACTTTCHYCPCPLPPETVRCRLCGRLQERGGASSAPAPAQGRGKAQEQAPARA